MSMMVGFSTSAASTLCSRGQGGELERKRSESMEGRSISGRGIAGRGIASRVNFGSPSEQNVSTKQQATVLLGLGREILLVLKLVMASVMVLYVPCFILIMNN
uniref:Uncharacterized protein n=1 Tax=Triticum urartu TaxID=4572 RepID=A0A8R7UH18_TRIUA